MSSQLACEASEEVFDAMVKSNCCLGNRVCVHCFHCSLCMLHAAHATCHSPKECKKGKCSRCQQCKVHSCVCPGRINEPFPSLKRALQAQQCLDGDKENQRPPKIARNRQQEQVDVTQFQSVVSNIVSMINDSSPNGEHRRKLHYALASFVSCFPDELLPDFVFKCKGCCTIFSDKTRKRDLCRKCRRLKEIGIADEMDVDYVLSAKQVKDLVCESFENCHSVDDLRYLDSVPIRNYLPRRFGNLRICESEAQERSESCSVYFDEKCFNSSLKTRCKDCVREYDRKTAQKARNKLEFFDEDDDELFHEVNLPQELQDMIKCIDVAQLDDTFRDFWCSQAEKRKHSMAEHKTAFRYTQYWNSRLRCQFGHVLPHVMNV